MTRKTIITTGIYFLILLALYACKKDEVNKITENKKAK